MSSGPANACRCAQVLRLSLCAALPRVQVSNSMGDRRVQYRGAVAFSLFYYLVLQISSLCSLLFTLNCFYLLYYHYVKMILARL